MSIFHTFFQKISIINIVETIGENDCWNNDYETFFVRWNQTNITSTTNCIILELICNIIFQGCLSAGKFRKWHLCLDLPDFWSRFVFVVFMNLTFAQANYYSNCKYVCPLKHNHLWTIKSLLEMLEKLELAGKIINVWNVENKGINDIRARTTRISCQFSICWSFYGEFC